MCLGANVRKAGHDGERGVVIKQMCGAMSFVGVIVQMYACLCAVFVLIVF